MWRSINYTWSAGFRFKSPSCERVDVTVGLPWFALLQTSLMTCSRPLIYFERDSECYTVFIVLNLFTVYEMETLTESAAGAGVRSGRGQKARLFHRHCWEFWPWLAGRRPPVPTAHRPRLARLLLSTVPEGTLIIFGLPGPWGQGFCHIQSLFRSRSCLFWMFM